MLGISLFPNLKKIYVSGGWSTYDNRARHYYEQLLPELEWDHKSYDEEDTGVKNSDYYFKGFEADAIDGYFMCRGYIDY